jgi:hypothetical protein
MRLSGLLALLGVAACLSGAPAHAQGVDIGLVNLLSGDVDFAAPGATPAKAQAFMRVRDGDRFNVPAGSVVRVVYFETARQERWAGPASFRAGRQQGAATSGAPAEVVSLPSGVPKRIARVPDLLQNAKLGGVQVRSAPISPKPLTADEEKQVAEARTLYQQMRAQASTDDIAPELFLYSALSEYSLHADMQTVVDEMARRQPASENVKALATWLKTRLGR